MQFQQKRVLSAILQALFHNVRLQNHALNNVPWNSEKTGLLQREITQARGSWRKHVDLRNATMRLQRVDFCC